MLKPLHLLKSSVVLFVAGLHVASLAAIFSVSNNHIQPINMGLAAPLQVHNINILGDSTISSVEEAPASIDELIKDEMIEKIEEAPEKIVFEEPVALPEEHLIATNIENQKNKIIKPLEEKPKRTPKTKPIIKPIPKKQVAEDKNASKAQSVSMQKPLVTNVAILKNPTPHYPRSARLRKETGKVVVLMEFDEKGIPMHVRVERSSGFVVLDDSALKAAKSVRSRPYVQEGRAISFRHRMIYEFNLRNH